MWAIYSFYTVLAVLLLKISGMPWWEALNHGMTGIATGGFSITSNSFIEYSPLSQLAAIIIMVTSSISFGIHAQFLNLHQLSILWSNTQHKALWLLLVLGTFALMEENYLFTGSFKWLDSLFQWTSALTTCGFNTVKVETWSPGSRLLISLAMIRGAAAGSTCGGLKLSRVVTLYKAITWHISSVFSKSQDPVSYLFDSEELSAQQAYRQIKTATVLATLWLGFLGLAVLILLNVVPFQYTIIDVFFEAASAMGTSGLSVGISHPSLSWIGKVILIVLMWLGRVEIIPILVFFVSLVLLLKSRCRAFKIF